MRHWHPRTQGRSQQESKSDPAAAMHSLRLCHIVSRHFCPCLMLLSSQSNAVGQCPCLRMGQLACQPAPGITALTGCAVWKHQTVPVPMSLASTISAVLQIPTATGWPNRLRQECLHTALPASSGQQRVCTTCVPGLQRTDYCQHHTGEGFTELTAAASHTGLLHVFI